MEEQLTNFDAADDLASEEAISVFMEDAIETENPDYIAHALEVVERARRRLVEQV